MSWLGPEKKDSMSSFNTFNLHRTIDALSFLRLSLCSSVCLSICLFMLFSHKAILAFSYYCLTLPVCPFICPFVDFAACACIFMFVHMCVSLFFSLSVCLSVCF